MHTINRQSKLPYYQQLYEILHGQIKNGDWKSGEMMPSESELMNNYQVSRNTVRQVLDMLVNDGLIYRHRGKGTFLAHPSLEHTTTRILSFTEDMHNRGFKPGTITIESKLLPAPREIAERIQVNEGEELAKIVRLRLADGEPMSIEESFLIHLYCPGVLSHDYAKYPLRQILGRDYGIRLVRAKQIIHAINAPANFLKNLKVPVNAPLLFIERVTFSQDAIPIEFLRLYFRADRYSLFNELHD